MTRHTWSQPFRPVLAAAVLTVLGGLPAPAPALAAAVGPESTLSVGTGHVGGEGQRFGEYSGLEDDGPYPLLDLDLNHLDPDTGTWLRVRGRNLGLDNRELRLEHHRQGHWRYALAYSRIPHREPYQVNTGLGGIGTDQATIVAITPGAGTDLRLHTRRDVFRLEAAKELPGGLGVAVRFKDEEKQGARRWGRTGIEFLAEPIDSSTRQWEAVVSFTGERTQLAVGYYGTAFANRFKGLVVDGVTDGPNNVYSPIGLPPDNVSHQVTVSGGHDFTPATRGHFKLDYGRITQDDAFIPTVTLAPGVGGDLNGEVEILRAQLGLASRPAPRLTLRGRLRYDSRDEQTPVLTYYSGAGATSRTNGDNEPRDIRTTNAAVEAGYLLPGDLRVSGGVDIEAKHRSVSPVRSVSVRERTHETSYRLEARRALSGATNGALTYIRRVRGGSDFAFNVRNDGSAGSNNVAPVHYADRRRDQVRLTLDGMPSERLSVQLVADVARDEYGSRTAQDLGANRGNWRHASLDGTYLLGGDWRATGFVAYDRTLTDQTGCDGISSTGAPCAAADLWRAQLVERGIAVGAGVRGQAGERVTLGADLEYTYDTGRYRQYGASTSPMPALYYKQTTLRVFAERALGAHSAVGVDAAYDRRQTNDWTWVGWTYDDGTTLSQSPNDDVVWVGARYRLTWR
jgi:MtrB/PioB family decaheme-associated outer membrane protein